MLTIEDIYEHMSTVDQSNASNDLGGVSVLWLCLLHVREGYV